MVIFCYFALFAIVVVFCGFSFSEAAADAVCSDLTLTELGNRNNFGGLEGGCVESVKTTGK